MKEIFSPRAENTGLTYINYNPAMKAVFGAVIFGAAGLALQSIEQGVTGQSLPRFMRGRLADVMGAPFAGVWSKGLIGDNFKLNLAAAMAIPSAVEIAQAFSRLPGTFDWGDFGAYAVGTAFWAVFEGSAKALHDSGITVPIYRALGIKHRKFG